MPDRQSCIIHTAIENAPKNLCFPGYVERDELRDAYCGCDLFALLSNEETEGIVVLKALACGLHIVCFHAVDVIGFGPAGCLS